MAKKATQTSKAATPAKSRSVSADQLEIKSVTKHYVGQQTFDSVGEAEAYLATLRELNRVSAPVAAIMNRTAARKRADVKAGVLHACEMLVKHPDLLALLVGTPAKDPVPTPAPAPAPAAVVEKAPVKVATKKAAPKPAAKPAPAAKAPAAKKVAKPRTKRTPVETPEANDAPTDTEDLSKLPPPAGASGPPPFDPSALPS